MFSLRNRKIKNCIEKIRSGKRGDLTAIWTLQEMDATEAVPELMDIFKQKIEQHDSTNGWILAALSEIGCPDQSDELLHAMINEVDYYVQRDRSVWGTRLPSMLWETRAHYLEAASRCKIEDFDALLKTFFASGANIDGYLVTCLRILSWKLGIPSNILQLGIDFNTIYRQSNPITCEIFENPIEHAFKSICKHNCPMSTTLLYLIQKKEDVVVHFYASGTSVAKRTLEFDRWRWAATQEMYKRHYPEKNILSYQSPCTCDVKYQPEIPPNAVGGSRWWHW